jgi:hypothetical protein
LRSLGLVDGGLPGNGRHRIRGAAFAAPMHEEWRGGSLAVMVAG